MKLSHFGFMFAACIGVLFSAAAYFAAPIAAVLGEAFPPDPASALKRQVQATAPVDYSIGLSQTRSFIDRLLARTDTTRRPSLALAV